MIDPSCVLGHHQFLQEEESEINEAYFDPLYLEDLRNSFTKDIG